MGRNCHSRCRCWYCRARVTDVDTPTAGDGASAAGARVTVPTGVTNATGAVTRRITTVGNGAVVAADTASASRISELTGTPLSPWP